MGIINLWRINLEDVVVFIDYQNVYKLARTAFFSDGDANFKGQINPILLGSHLISRNALARQTLGLPDQNLKQVRIYTGVPSPIHDQSGNERTRRQLSAWSQLDSRIEIVQRELRYPRGWPTPEVAGSLPREKGVDIALAVDFVTMAYKGEFDMGILFSADTDFKPVLEYVWPSAIRAKPEVAAWRGSNSQQIRNGSYNQRLSLDSFGKLPFCHWLTIDDYNAVKDHTNYRTRTIRT